MRATLSLLLQNEGYEVEEAPDGETAIESIVPGAYDLVLTDLKMSRGDGMSVLAHAAEHAPATPVIVMTAYGTIENAVEAVKRGAFDYIEKPFSEDALNVKVNQAFETSRLRSEVKNLASDFRERYHLEAIIGRSQAVRNVLGRIVRIAPTEATVLITGESGTGKELVARAIHANSSRSDRAFVSVNCAAITETLLESELFGHAKGAFTGAASARKGLFEEADGSTFFFDEIAETPPSFQAKLLRAIQEGEVRRLGENKPIHVDVRIIAATNQNLKEAIAEKRFRQDLYYRLNVGRFVLPPLRERREDIPLLAEHFLQKFAKQMNRQNARFEDAAFDFLRRYDFPGNVRELENMIEQAVALSLDGTVRLDDVIPPEDEFRTTTPAGSVRSLQDVIDDAEREAIRRVLDEVDGNREQAASLLGLSATTLWRKMKRLSIS